MSKIENWSAKHNQTPSSVVYRWVHDGGDHRVIVMKEPGPAGQSTVYFGVVKYSDRLEKPNMGLGSGFTNKEEARKDAVEWMRNHPNP